MNNILVTGSNGQLGSELQELKNQFSQFSFHFHDVDTLDITDIIALKKIVSEIKPSYIINCAAYTAVDKAETETGKAYLINEKAVKLLSEVAIEFNSRLIHTSTDYVFDGLTCIPYKEGDKTNPVSAYGKSKLAGEKCLDNNPNSIIIRTAWLYSSFGNNFVKTMLRLGKERSEIKVVFDQVGSPTYAADLAHAIVTIISKIETGQKEFTPGIYHYSNEGACSWFDLASEIMVLAGLPTKIKPIETFEYPTPTIRPAYSVFNKAKIKNTYGIEIPWWNDSLKKCMGKLA